MNLFILSTDTCFGIACPTSEVDSYKKIFKLKARDYSKPLAILVMDLNYLRKNTSLSEKQISFLQNYKKPWTILLDKEKIKDKKLLNQISKLPNSDIYNKIAFRITQTFMQRSLITDFGPLFLTSANKSGNPEIFDTINVKKEFEEEIEKYGIKVFAHNDFCINSSQAASDIFEFVGDSEEIKYLRKN